MNTTENFLELLSVRFHQNIHLHQGISWEKVQEKLLQNPSKISIIEKMEETGGVPDVIGIDEQGMFLFCDCSPESPSGRRSLCYDQKALDSRKNAKPQGSARGLAQEMGIEMLDENLYRELQMLAPFDQKTSSWIATPESIRSLGGAVFADRRYDTVFVYHNGAESYYSARGFRGMCRV